MPDLANLAVLDPGTGIRHIMLDTGNKYHVAVATIHSSRFFNPDEAARLFQAAPALVELARKIMRDHRAQLPSAARDLYGGGCGCPQCELARQILDGLEVTE